MMPRSILLADDEDAVRSVIRTSLESAGYDVCEAANGREALKAAQAAPFDLAIIDVLMPECDGLETIIGVRREQRSVPIIAISGAANQVILESAAGLGATRVLPKPFRTAELMGLVDELLGTRVTRG